MKLRNVPGKRPLLIIILVLSLGVFFTLPLLAEENLKEDPDTGEKIYLDAKDYVKSDQETIIAVGDVKIDYRDYDILGPRVVIALEENLISLEEGIRLTGKDLKLKAGRGYFYTEDEKLVAQKNVELEYTVKGKDDKPEILNLLADELEYFGDPAVVKGSGNVNIEYKQYILKGDSFEYSEEEEVMVLTGNASVLEENGNLIRAKQIIYNLSDETIEARDGVAIEFLMNEE